MHWNLKFQELFFRFYRVWWYQPVETVYVFSKSKFFISSSFEIECRHAKRRRVERPNVWEGRRRRLENRRVKRRDAKRRRVERRAVRESRRESSRSDLARVRSWDPVKLELKLLLRPGGRHPARVDRQLRRRNHRRSG